jgi:peroxiredoxin
LNIFDPNYELKYRIMKKIIYLPVVFLIMWACSSEPHYTIKGKIAGSDSVKFYLKKRAEGKTVNIDSAVSKNGTFTMKGGKVEYPQLVYLVAGNTRKMKDFYLENSAITIDGKLDSLYLADVKGSKTQDEYQSLINDNKMLTAQYSKFLEQYQQASQSGNFTGADAYRKQMDSVENEMIKLQKDFVKNNPKSYVTPSILASLAYDMDGNEIEQAVKGLDTSLVKLPQMKSLLEHAQAMKAVAIGQKAPDFTMNDPDGKPVSLSSKIGAKLLLVDFWAGWCGPCRQENPNVVKVYNEFHKKGFDVFGVSLDHTKDQWLKAIADDKLAWTHVSDLQYWNNAAAKLYAVQAIPANFLLDETGTIIGRNLRGEALYNKVSEVLGK